MNPTLSHMDMNRVLVAFGIAEAAAVLASHWESSTVSLPKSLPRYLSPETISPTHAKSGRELI